jgi:hypothetical protein
MLVGILKYQGPILKGDIHYHSFKVVEHTCSQFVNSIVYSLLIIKITCGPNHIKFSMLIFSPSF